MEYDIAIVGTGPGGLEAALTAKLRNKNILLLGSSDLSEKIDKAHVFENYLGLSHISGSELNKAFLDHIKSLGIEITNEKVMNIYDMGDSFTIQAEKNMYNAKTVILA